MAISRRPEGGSHLLRQQTNESGRAELHHHGKGGFGGGVCLPEILPLSAGYRVVFHTDHKSLKYLVNKLDLSGRIARWILLLQEFNYKVVVKPGKANSNADYLSRQRGAEAASTILPSFPDEFGEEWAKDFPEDVPVFHLSGEGSSAYEDVIRYLTEKAYPPGLSQEEKMVFQTKAAPFTLIKETLFQMGPDDQLRRCLEKPEHGKVIRALHLGPLGGHFVAVTTIQRIRKAGYWWPYINRDVNLRPLWGNAINVNGQVHLPSGTTGH